MRGKSPLWAICLVAVILYSSVERSPFRTTLLEEQNGPELSTVRRRMRSVALQIEKEQEDRFHRKDFFRSPTLEQKGGLAAQVEDMASQAEKINAEAKISEAEVQAARKMVRLKNELLEAADEKLKSDKIRNIQAEEGAEQWEGQLNSMIQEIDNLTRESRAKSVESEARAKVANMLLSSVREEKQSPWNAKDNTALWESAHPESNLDELVAAHNAQDATLRKDTAILSKMERKLQRRKLNSS